MKYKVGIIGHGFVGIATETGMQSIKDTDIDIRVHDKYKESESLDDVVGNSSILFICVPTPMNFESGECDLSVVEEVVENINNIELGKNIVIKSTVLPGTTKRLAKQYPDQNFVFNPEFLTEKNFILDFLNQDRIILGGATDYIGFDNEVFYLYQDFVQSQETPAVIKITDSKIAEMVKYMGNCMLASKIIFCNEMAEICKAINIDYSKVAELVSLDKRIGSSHMKVPGLDGKHGFGGSCFSKDINALITFAKEQDLDPIVLETAWTKNLLVREEYEWEILPQVNGKYVKK